MGNWLDDVVLASYKLAKESPSATLRNAAKEGPLAAFAIYRDVMLDHGGSVFFRYDSLAAYLRANGESPESLNAYNKAVMGTVLGQVYPAPGHDEHVFETFGCRIQRTNIKVDKEVALDLYGHEPPEVDFWEEMLQDGDSIYMDFTDCDLFLTPGANRLRAIVASKKQVSARHVANAPWLQADVGTEIDFNVAIQPVDQVLPTECTWMHGNVAHGVRKLHGLLLFGPDVEVDAEVVGANCINLFQMCWLLYLEKKEELALEPYITERELRATRRPDKQVTKLRNVSLFQMRSLKTPIRLVPPEARVAAGDRVLTVRVAVRGHWRLVPHGPGKTLRRLKWIAPFERGPKDAPAKLTMDVLRHP